MIESIRWFYSCITILLNGLDNVHGTYPNKSIYIHKCCLAECGKSVALGFSGIPKDEPAIVEFQQVLSKESSFVRILRVFTVVIKYNPFALFEGFMCAHQNSLITSLHNLTSRPYTC